MTFFWVCLAISITACSVDRYSTSSRPSPPLRPGPSPSPPEEESNEEEEDSISVQDDGNNPSRFPSDRRPEDIEMARIQEV